MKSLFIIHSTNTIYGAARSLSTVTRNWDDEFDIILPKDFPRDIFRKKSRYNEDDFRQFYGKNLQNIYYMWLPFSFPIDVEYKETLKWKVKYRVNYLLGKLFCGRIKKIIRSNSYDIIHLNSLILFPLLKKKQPMYIHVREVANAGKIRMKLMARKLMQARGIVFIDYATQKPFGSVLKDTPSIVLNNPFDMRGIEQLDKGKIRKRYGIYPDEVVFTIAGNVSEFKGVDFVIKSFVKTNMKAKLLVVGSGGEEFIEKCKGIIGSDSRVIMIGEISDMYPIYAISDYIVRGDDQFCIGRTIYEGVYAGVGVIIPGKETNQKDVFQYEEIKDRLFFYTPRSEEELKSVFEKCDIIDDSMRIGKSNVPEYLEKFNEFVVDNR